MKEWRWGHWKFRHAPDPADFLWEFVQPRECLDALVLAEADYGDVATDAQKSAATKLGSESTGYGGETTIEVADADAELIARAVNELLRGGA